MVPFNPLRGRIENRPIKPVCSYQLDDDLFGFAAAESDGALTATNAGGPGIPPGGAPMGCGAPGGAPGG